MEPPLNLMAGFLNRPQARGAVTICQRAAGILAEKTESHSSPLPVSIDQEGELRADWNI